MMQQFVGNALSDFVAELFMNILETKIEKKQNVFEDIHEVHR